MTRNDGWGREDLIQESDSRDYLDQSGGGLGPGAWEGGNNSI